MSKIFLIFLLALPLFTCTKFGKNVTIKGRVMNPITGAGIPDAEVKLLKSTIGLPGGDKKIKSVFSDSNGDFELNKLTFSGYKATCSINGLYDLGWTKDNGATFTGNFTLEVKKGKVMHADYYAVPYGSIQFHIQNVNCEGSLDSMRFRSRSQFESNFPESWSSYRTGCYNYVSSGASLVHCGTWYYETRVKHPSGTISVYDTVFVSESGVAQLELFY
jgi:hypothetical protein